MIIRNSQPPQPILAISPASLDFGLVNYAEEAAEGHGIARLTIRNDGDRMLVGRIAIQVSWVTAYPPDFRLNPGESSDHLFTVRRVNQLTWNSGHKLGSDFIALINSNGGSETIGGYYYIDNAETVKKRAPLSPRIFAFLALGLLLTAAVLYFVFWQDRKITETRTTEQVSAFYTQIAETIHADIAAQLPTPTRTIVVPAAALATPARPGASDSAAPVFTPWIPGDYPNPEDFVRSYYATIAEGRLSDAWWMMSEKSQIACCYNKGGNPADYFAANWAGISELTVNYVFLQTENQNPAVLNAEITFKNEDGTSGQSDLQIEVIASSQQGTLLIDSIK